MQMVTQFKYSRPVLFYFERNTLYETLQMFSSVLYLFAYLYSTFIYVSSLLKNAWKKNQKFK